MTTDILTCIQDAVLRGEIQNPLIMELCDAIGKTIFETPHAVGEMVYFIGSVFSKDVYEAKIYRVIPKITKQGIYYNYDINYQIVDPFYSDGRMAEQGAYINQDSFGKTVFLTEQSAKDALERSKE